MVKKEEKLLEKKRFRMEKAHWFGIVAALIITFVSLLLFFLTDWFDSSMLYFLLGIALVIGGLPFFVTLIIEGRAEINKETSFLEFSRDLVESVRSGTSISKSIINIRTKDYGVLNSHIDKLANQISLGIPVRDALNNFSKAVKSKVISRAITLIQEAERAGGRIETILESVASSVGQVEKLRKERKAAIYNLTVQGYIVFIIFIAIMLVMQFKILPITTDLGAVGDLSESGFTSDDFGGINIGQESPLNKEDLSRAFMYLLIVQGLFAGLVIGKISEGTIQAGLKHSFILVVLALLLSTGATVFFG